MASIDKQYHSLAATILRDGFHYGDRSRSFIGMLQIPSYRLVVDIAENSFPLLTTKKIYYKAIIHELIWMLSGSTNIDYLQENNISIWNDDAYNYSQGTEVGRIYGAQWRSWTAPNLKHGFKYIDQIKSLIHGLKTDFMNRRHIVTAWNPAELNEMALPPCHWSFEVLPQYKNNDIGFMIKWHQRSVDTFLGLPFDIGLYAFLGKIIEKLIGLPFLTLEGDLSNVHFYKPHIPLVRKQLERSTYLTGPDFQLTGNIDIDNLSIKNFKISNYKPQPAIKAKLYTKTTHNENCKSKNS